VGLIAEIGGGPVALDTVAFIYFIEANPRYLPALDPVFVAVDKGRLSAVTSGITLLEVLVIPCRAGNVPLAESYERLLTGSRGLRLIDVDRAQLRSAAQLRAIHAGLRTPDALQVCAALAGGCLVFVTNDRSYPPVPGLRVLQLRDFVS
jgi:predicted nucleic acid-binding protein